MTPTMFANIAGRAGRAGSFTEGDTILYDNPLGEPVFTHPTALMREFFLAERLPGLQSAFESTEEPESDSLRAALASQLVAAIPESPAVSSLVTEPTMHMLVTRSEDHERAALVEQMLREAEDELLSAEGGLPVAVANSPLQLTPFGIAANRTGFSPRSARRIVTALRADAPGLELAVVGAHLLRDLGDIPEQPSGKFRQLLRKPRTRFYVTPDDVEDVLTMWLENRAVEEIFACLPKVRRSSIKPAVDDWLEGRPSSGWDAAFDGFVDFIAGVIQSFIPWLFRACETLAPHAGGWSEELPWRQWADEVETAGQAELGEPEPAS
jgi:helicase